MCAILKPRDTCSCSSRYLRDKKKQEQADQIRAISALQAERAVPQWESLKLEKQMVKMPKVLV